MHTSLDTDPVIRAEFLKSACDDTQEVIRSLDQKANSLLPVVLLPLPVIGWIVGQQWDRVQQRALLYGLGLFALVVAVLWLLAIIHLVRCLYPRSNPADFVPEEGRPVGAYYGADLFPKWRLLTDASALRATRTVGQHLDRVPQTASDAAREYAFEHLKLVFIREVKIRRLRCGVALYVASIMLLGVLALLWQLAR